MLFLLLEELFYSLLYCFGRETFIIQCHLLIVQAMAIGLAIWGIKERNHFLSNLPTDQSENKGQILMEILLTLKVYGRISIVSSYIFISILFRTCPLFFAKLLKLTHSFGTVS